MSKEEIVAFLSDMVDALTLKRVALLTILGAISVALMIGFENRTIIFNKMFSAPVESLTIPWEMSDESKRELTSLASSQSLVGGVLVSEVNLKKNRKITKFWYVEDAALKEQAANIIATLLPQAFFDTDKNNNDQMVGVVGNQFVCSPTVETVYVRYLPNMPKKLPYICRLAVPPFVGEFAGFITLALVRPPTKSEMDSLRIELTRISIEFYLRDIDRKLRGKATQ